MSGLQAALAVFVGSGLGGVGRFGVAKLSARWLSGLAGAPWPGLVGTLTVNLVGSALLGFLVSRQHLGQGLDSATVRLALTTGFMGGFTTYSTFNTEVVTLLQNGRGREAVGYLAATVVLCLMGGTAGYLLALRT